jgi:predicted ATPase
MYIDSVKFNHDYRCFNAGDQFEFKDLTLLVGDQGCGKSSLLDLLGRNCPELELSLTDLGLRGVETFYFDTEKMNPRIVDAQMYTNPNGTNRGIGIGRAISSRFTSHGETIVDFTVNALKTAKNCLFFLDEPESGLSIRNQFRLLKETRSAIKRKCQLVIATHSLLLISKTKSVLSLEHGRWIDSKSFIKSHAVGL